MARSGVWLGKGGTLTFVTGTSGSSEFQIAYNPQGSQKWFTPSWPKDNVPLLLNAVAGPPLWISTPPLLLATRPVTRVKSQPS